MGLFSTTGKERIGWGLLGVLIAAFVAFVVYSFVGALVVGLFLYYAIRPVYRWLDDWIDHPSVNATITMLVVGLPILLVIGYAVFLAVRELNLLLQTMNFGQLRSQLGPLLDVVAATDEVGLRGFIRNNLSQIRRIASIVLTWFLRIFVLVTVCYYLLQYDRAIADWFRQSFEDYPTVVEYMESVDDDLTTIYTGNLITIGVTSVLAAVVFYGLNVFTPSGVGLRFPVLLGLSLGLGTLIPAVGMKIIYFPYTGYLLWRSIQSQAVPIWFPVVFFVLTVLVVDTFPDFFIRSYLSKGNINMGWMLLTYVLAATAFGWWGVFFGPIILVAFLNFARRIFPVLLDRDASLRADRA